MFLWEICATTDLFINYNIINMNFDGVFVNVKSWQRVKELEKVRLSVLIWIK